MFTSLMCIAVAVYYEARGEPTAGQIAVAQVIRNRIEDPRYPVVHCTLKRVSTRHYRRCYALPQYESVSRMGIHRR